MSSENNQHHFGVTGICNAIVDLYVHLSDEELEKLKFAKSSYGMQSLEEQRDLLGRVKSYDPKKINGGSVANSIVTFSQVSAVCGKNNGRDGAYAAMLACVGDDPLGEFYRSESQRCGVFMPLEPHPKERTGSCVVCVTPDAERTMRTYLGASLHLNERDIKSNIIDRSSWVFLEGYVVANPGHGEEVTKALISRAKSAKAKIAFTCSDPWVVKSAKAIISASLGSIDLLFANEYEALELTNSDNLDVALAQLAKLVPFAAVTLGAQGACIIRNGVQTRVNAVPCNPVDLTGAGDSFAGGFLWGIEQGYSDRNAAELGCLLAAEVITQVGPRLSEASVASVARRVC
jgi:sugar/nucleoside kinase (ribokinase family)